MNRRMKLITAWLEARDGSPQEAAALRELARLNHQADLAAQSVSRRQGRKARP